MIPSNSEILKQAQSFYQNNYNTIKGRSIVSKGEPLLAYPSQLSSESLEKNQNTGFKINTLKILVKNYSKNDEIVASTVVNPTSSIHPELEVTGDNQEGLELYGGILKSGEGINNSKLNLGKLYPSDSGNSLKDGKPLSSDIPMREVMNSETFTFTQNEIDTLNGTQKKILLGALGRNPDSCILFGSWINNLLIPQNDLSADGGNLYYVQAIPEKSVQEDALLNFKAIDNYNGITKTIYELCEGKFEATIDKSNKFILRGMDVQNSPFRVKFESENPTSIGEDGYLNWELSYSTDSGVTWNSYNPQSYWISYNQIRNNGDLRLPLPFRQKNSMNHTQWISLTLPIQNLNNRIESFMVIDKDSNSVKISDWDTEIDNTAAVAKVLLLIPQELYQHEISIIQIEFKLNNNVKYLTINLDQLILIDRINYRLGLEFNIFQLEE